MRTKLEILEEQIRKALPRLIEVREGCLLKQIDTDKIFKIFCECDKYFRMVLINRNLPETLSVRKKSTQNNFKIIGHDILLSDVLEWLEETRPNSNLTIELNRVSSIREGYSMTLFIQFDDLDCDWYLSKPHLKDQNEELIDFLYDLIKK